MDELDRGKNSFHKKQILAYPHSLHNLAFLFAPHGSRFLSSSAVERVAVNH